MNIMRIYTYTCIYTYTHAKMFNLCKGYTCFHSYITMRLQLFLQSREDGNSQRRCFDSVHTFTQNCQKSGVFRSEKSCTPRRIRSHQNAQHSWTISSNELSQNAARHARARNMQRRNAAWQALISYSSPNADPFFGEWVSEYLAHVPSGSCPDM